MWLLSGALLCQTMDAQGGDPEAHANAIYRANDAVAANPAFAHGVGAPEFTFPPHHAECNQVPSHCASETREGQKINEPDDWSCLDFRQPRSMLLANLEGAFGQSLLANLFAKAGVSAAAMACNYSHFVNNSRLPPSDARDADSALNATWASAEDVLDAIRAERFDEARCDAQTWRRYLERIYNALHFAQDATCEHHALGNVRCSFTSMNPLFSRNPILSFTEARSCGSWIAETLSKVGTSYPCDASVVEANAPEVLNNDSATLFRMCNVGSSLACMGLERVLRHHCDLGDEQHRKTIVCEGEQRNHDPASKRGYCEGEPSASAGGEDFVAKAAEQSRLLLEKAGHAWAVVCGNPNNAGEVGAGGAGQVTSPHSEGGGGAGGDGSSGSAQASGGMSDGAGSGGGGAGETGEAGSSDGGPPDPVSATVGSGIGDPHLVTFDGARYDCQPKGEETLVLSPAGDLELQIRTEQWAGYNVSSITAVAVRLGTDTLGFYLDGRVQLNHAPASFAAEPLGLAGGGSVQKQGNRHRLIWPDQTEVWVDVAPPFMNVRAYLAPARRGNVAGLLGNANGNAGDDLILRGGKEALATPVPMAAFYGSYVESWRVTPETSLFDYLEGESTAFFTDRSFPSALMNTASLSDQEVSDATAVCQAAHVAPEWLDACVLDVALANGNAQATAGFAQAPDVTTLVEVQPPKTHSVLGCTPPVPRSSLSGCDGGWISALGGGPLKGSTCIHGVPSPTEDFAVFVIDTTGIPGTTLQIDLTVGAGASSASLDLFTECQVVPTSGSVPSVRNAHDVRPNSKTRFAYPFKPGDVLQLGIEGNWFSPPTATNSVDFVVSSY